MDSNAHTLVLDVGKSNAKLVLFNAEGDVIARRVRANRSVQTPHYLALGLDALQAWVLESVPTLPEHARIGRIGITTHGAAFCAVNGSGLALPAIDYEWDGYGDLRADYASRIDGFETTGTPLLPLGLNAGLQLYWLQQTQPEAWQGIEAWLPYPQYWAWWFTGVAVNEVSSLGCHTHLWQPARNRFAPWAVREGLVERFPPLRRAHEAIGPVRPALAERLGLPAGCVVHAGLHDSNACLARHLHALPGASVVSTGTWCVVMTPGVTGSERALDPAREQLLNQSIEGRPVPTARFMGGREFAHLCHGADPALATERALHEVLEAGWLVLPGHDAGPAASFGQAGEIVRGDQPMGSAPQVVPLHLRPALAAMYCAMMTTRILFDLLPPALRGHPQRSDALSVVVLEGPLADNPAYAAALSALLAPLAVVRSQDEVEGTARGAWLSTRWAMPSHGRDAYASVPPPTAQVSHSLLQRFRQWSTAADEALV